MNKLLNTLIALLFSVSIYGQKDIEPLSRGAVAIPCEKGNFISWRYLITDPESISFDLMRDGELIASNITKTTCVTDTLGTSTSQYILITRKLGTKYASKPLKVWDKPYISIPLDKPVDGVAPNGKQYTYTPNDCSVADINGDGEINTFDIITINKYLADRVELNDLQLESADMLKDGQVTSADVAVLEKFVLGEYKVLPVTMEMIMNGETGYN